MSKTVRTTERMSQKITSILIGAVLTAYSVVFMVNGVGPYFA